MANKPLQLAVGESLETRKPLVIAVSCSYLAKQRSAAECSLQNQRFQAQNLEPRCGQGLGSGLVSVAIGRLGPRALSLPLPPGQVGDEHDVVGQAKKETLPAVYGRFAVETKGWPGR